MYNPLSPNLEYDDFLISLKNLICPIKWSKCYYQMKLKEKLLEIFPNAKEIFLFNSGRSALMIGLKSLHLKKDDKVFLQAFTCSSVVNSLLWNRLKPIYIDINPKDFNIDYKKLYLQKTKAKALIVQHTFGVPPSFFSKIVKFCKSNKIYLIEDCAHSLGATYKKGKLGSFGDMTILSFGRDKVISSVFGGALIVNNKKLAKAVKKEYKKIRQPFYFWTLQQLLHPVITYIAKKIYPLWGSFIVFLAQKIGIISRAISKVEKEHKTPSFFPYLLPEPLSHLAYNQILKLDRFNSKRKRIALIYHRHIKNNKIFKPSFKTGGIFLKYTIRTKRPQKLRDYLKKNGIHLEKTIWYSQVVTPSLNLDKACYPKGNCPVAEKICKESFNLPTSPTMNYKTARKIAKLLNRWQG